MVAMNRPQETGTEGSTTPTTVPSPGVPKPPTEADVGTQQESDLQIFPPARWARVGGKWVYDTHQGVVEQNGAIRNYYWDGEENQIWFGMSASMQATITDIFDKKGLPTGSINAVLSSFRTLLGQANSLGESWRSTLNRFEKLPDYKKTSTGPAYRVANPADLRAVAKAVFRETIGREANEDEMTRFISSYQQAQRVGAGGSVAAPSAEVAAQDFARIAAPKEAAAYEMLGYIGQFVNAVQGVGR
jgi:hypothetical protein